MATDITTFMIAFEIGPDCLSRFVFAASAAIFSTLGRRRPSYAAKASGKSGRSRRQRASSIAFQPPANTLPRLTTARAPRRRLGPSVRDTNAERSEARRWSRTQAVLQAERPQDLARRNVVSIGFAQDQQPVFQRDFKRLCLRHRLRMRKVCKPQHAIVALFPIPEKPRSPKTKLIVSDDPGAPANDEYPPKPRSPVYAGPGA